MATWARRGSQSSVSQTESFYHLHGESFSLDPGIHPAGIGGGGGGLGGGGGGGAGGGGGGGGGLGAEYDDATKGGVSEQLMLDMQIALLTRSQRDHDAAVAVQSHWRGAVARQGLVQRTVDAAVTSIQSHARGWSARREARTARGAR